MVARRVRCRGAPVRRLPVARRPSSSRATRSGGRSVRVRAAASSMASGMPSRRRQISSTSSRWASGSKLGSAAPAPERGTAPLRRRDPAARRPRPAHRRRRDAHATWPGPAPAGSPRRSPRTSSAAPVDDMLTVVDDEQRRPRPQRRDNRLRQRAPRSLGDAQGVGHGSRHVVRGGDLGQLNQPGRRAVVGGRRAAAASASRVLPIPPGPTKRDDRTPSERLVDRRRGRRPGRRGCPGGREGGRGHRAVGRVAGTR